MLRLVAVGAVSDLVDNAAIREAVEGEMAKSDGPTLALICRRLGWTYEKRGPNRRDGYRSPDTTRLRRRLGQVTLMTGNKKTAKSKRIHYDVALAICEAAGIDPVDAEL